MDPWRLPAYFSLSSSPLLQLQPHSSPSLAARGLWTPKDGVTWDGAPRFKPEDSFLQAHWTPVFTFSPKFNMTSGTELGKLHFEQWMTSSGATGVFTLPNSREGHFGAGNSSLCLNRRSSMMNRLASEFPQESLQTDGTKNLPHFCPLREINCSFPLCVEVSFFPHPALCGLVV